VSAIKDPSRYENVLRGANLETEQPLRVWAYHASERFDSQKVAQVWPSPAPPSLINDIQPDCHYFKWMDDSASPPTSGPSSAAPLDHSEYDVFLFGNGTVVLWGMTAESAKNFVQRNLQALQVKPIKPAAEWMEYCYGSEAGISNDRIVLAYDESEEGRRLNVLQQKMAFSYGLSRSVKLETLESTVEKTIEKTYDVPKELAEHIEPTSLPKRVVLMFLELMGKDDPPYHKAMVILAELLQARATLNLQHSFTEDPETYWDNPDASRLLQNVSKHLDIPRRVKALNEKLDYSKEHLEVLRTHLHERHNLRLEWGIIILISIEVMFGFINLVRAVPH